MTTRIATTTVLSDEIRAVIRKQNAKGWTYARIAGEMNRLGHKGMTGTYLNHLVNDSRSRAFSVDEAAAIIAIFKSAARAAQAEIDRLTDALAGNSK